VTGTLGPDWPNDSGNVSSPSNDVPPQTANINRNFAARPAPEAVYQHCRWYNGTFTETFGGFAPSTSHTIRLHWAENYIDHAAQTMSGVKYGRAFNVAINGTTVLTNFDVWSAAKVASGGSTGLNIAVERDFTATADTSGNFVIQFSQGTYDNPMISGIEIQ
jgi:hypothetical protein